MAGVFGAVAVALGAFGAHALQKLVSEAALHRWETGVLYQFFHSLALMVIGLAGHRGEGRWIHAAAMAFVVGILLFSGSLYLLTFKDLLSETMVRIIGPVTPVGGLAFIAGWIFLAIHGQKQF